MVKLSGYQHIFQGEHMKSEIKKLPKSKVRISISLPQDAVDAEYAHVLDNYVESSKLPGFRKGKAPRTLVESHVGGSVLKDEAKNHAITEAYYEAVTEHAFHPLHTPAISSVDENDGLSFVAEVDCMPEVKVKNRHTIKIKPIEAKQPSEEDLEKVISHLRRERATLHEVNRPLRAGDFASISYTGTVGGVAQENMTSNNHPLVVGEGTLIPGFEDNLIGMQAGDSRTFIITFPKTYHDKTMAHQEAEFTATLDAMKELELPSLDAAFAADFGKKSADELKEAIKKQLDDEAATETRAKMQDAVLEELVKRTEVDLPETVVHDEIRRIIENLRNRLGLDEAKFARYLEQQQKSIDDLHAESRDQAIKNAIVGLALGAIMEEDGIDPHDKGSVEKVMEQLVQSATK